MNTILNLVYSDANNHKKEINVVLDGSINDDQIKIINQCLIDGEFVIAHQVGLPTPSLLFSEKYSFPTEDDHVYTKLFDFCNEAPCASSLLTKSEPTIDLTIDDFIHNISTVKWDELKESMRIGLI